MTTQLSKDVFRETRETFIRDGGKRRAVVVGLGLGDVITLRMKGTRRAYALPIEHVFYTAVKAFAQSERARKAAERKQRGR